MKLRIALTLVVTTLISSCSLKLAYNYADWWISWSVDDYVELTDEQETLLEEDIQNAFIWHRKNELPHYKERLVQLQNAIKSKDVVLLGQTFEQSKDLWLRTMHYLSPKITKHIDSLSDGQKQQLINNIRQKQKEEHTKWLEKSKRNEKDELGETIEELEEYFGEVTTLQLEALKPVIYETENLLDYRIASREKWLNLFEDAINLPKSTREAAIIQLMTQPSLYRSYEYQNKINERRKRYFDWYKMTLISLTKKQQKHLDGKLSDIIEDITELHLQ